MAQVDMPKSSIGQTPTEPKKKLEKVVKGKVAVKEQSDMQKIASQFLAEDLKTVKDRILTDYLLPMLKNGAWSILNSAFSIALWGEDRSRGGSNNYYGNNRGQRNSYDGYYQGSQNNRPNPPPVRRSLQNLDFESRGDAEDTLAGLRDALYRYRQVSVGDLCPNRHAPARLHPECRVFSETSVLYPLQNNSQPEPEEFPSAFQAEPCLPLACSFVPPG